MGTLPNLSILKGGNRSLRPHFLDKIFESVANTHETRTALIFKDNEETRTTTYKELDLITNNVARAISNTIKSNQLKSNNDGDVIIAVNMLPSDKLLITLLAIWKSGAAYLPLDPSFPQARISHILKESQPVMVICDQKTTFDGPMTKPYNELLNEGKALPSSSLQIDEKVQQLKSDLAIVLYTSGSTGIPKGVRLLHKTILNRLQWQFHTFPYSETEKVCVFKTALTFVDSVSEIWGPLLNGLSILIVPKTTTQDPEKLVHMLEHYQVERLVLVPTLLRSILMFIQLQNDKDRLRHLKLWVCSGETLVSSLVKEFFQYFVEEEHKLCNFYGSTEIMGDVTYYTISSLQQLKGLEQVPIGAPIDNTVVYLLDPDFRPVKAGEMGELFVAGLNLAAGYVNGRDPDKFIENPLAVDAAFVKLFRTGDFARVEQGTLMYEGRTDSQIKIRGHRVDLAEVEKAVNSIDGVEKGVVLCYNPGEINQALLAFVTANPCLNETDIVAALRKILTPYMIPEVLIIEDIPLLVNGKVDRQSLLKSYEVRSSDENTQTVLDFEGVLDCQKEAAKDLFEIVASVLSNSNKITLSKEVNFYQAGGNSLNSIYTITCLRDKGYQIGISDFISAGDLGEILERIAPGKPTSPLRTTLFPRYSAELLNDTHQKDVIDMVTSSFYLKADLEQWLMPHVYESDYSELVLALWQPLVEKRLSFVVKTETGKTVGVGLNFDARDEPEVEITSKLTIVFEFLETLEGPVRDNQLPKGKGKILHSFMMATNSTLTAKDNVSVMQFMEEEVIRLGRSRKFEGIFTTNTSPLTQQLGSDIYGYETFLDYQVNEYVASDESKPFGMAPNSQKALVQWKWIT